MRTRQAIFCDILRWCERLALEVPYDILRFCWRKTWKSFSRFIWMTWYDVYGDGVCNYEEYRKVLNCYMCNLICCVAVCWIVSVQHRIQHLQSPVAQYGTFQHYANNYFLRDYLNGLWCLRWWSISLWHHLRKFKIQCFQNIMMST